MRVHVVGSSGSGKTTFAARIAARLDVPHLELDSLRHQANWVELPDDEFLARVHTFVGEHDAWVVDGNYSVVRGAVWARATDIVYLDFPRWLVEYQVITRSLVRGITKRELWNGNREQFRTWVDPTHPIRWAWSTHARRRREYGQAAATDDRWTVLRTRKEASQWLASVPASA